MNDRAMTCGGVSLREIGRRLTEPARTNMEDASEKAKSAATGGDVVDAIRVQKATLEELRRSSKAS